MKRMQLMIPFLPLLISVFLVLSWHQNENLMKTSSDESIMNQQKYRVLFPEAKIGQMNLSQLKQLEESFRKKLVELSGEASSQFAHQLSVNLEKSIFLSKSLDLAVNRLNQINKEQKEASQVEESAEIERLTQAIRGMFHRVNQIKDLLLNKLSGADQLEKSNVSPKRRTRQQKSKTKTALQIRIRQLRLSSSREPSESRKQSDEQEEQFETKQQRDQVRLKRLSLRRQAKLLSAESMTQSTTNQPGEGKQMRQNPVDPQTHHTSSFKGTEKKVQTASSQDRRFQNALLIITKKVTFTKISKEQCQSLRGKINQLRLAEEQTQSQTVRHNLAGKANLAEKVYSLRCSPTLINAANYKQLQQLLLEVKKQMIASFEMKLVLQQIRQPLTCISSELSKILEALLHEVASRIDDKIQGRNAVALSQFQLYKLLRLAEDQIQEQKAQMNSKNRALQQQRAKEKQIHSRQIAQEAEKQHRRIRIEKQKQLRAKQDQRQRIILNQFGNKCQKVIDSLMVFLVDLSKIQSGNSQLQMKLHTSKVNKMLLRADLLMEGLNKYYKEITETDKKLLRLMKNKYDNVERTKILAKKDIQQKIAMIQQGFNQFSGKIKSKVLKQPFYYEKISQRVKKSNSIQDNSQQQPQSPTSSFPISAPTSPSSPASPHFKIFSQSAPTSPSTPLTQPFKRLSASSTSPGVSSVMSGRHVQPSPPPMGVARKMSPQKQSLLASLKQMKQEDKWTALAMPPGSDQQQQIMYKIPG